MTFGVFLACSGKNVRGIHLRMYPCVASARHFREKAREREEREKQRETERERERKKEKREREREREIPELAFGVGAPGYPHGDPSCSSSSLQLVVRVPGALISNHQTLDPRP
jgi:hypothetical protein